MNNVTFQSNLFALKFFCIVLNFEQTNPNYGKVRNGLSTGYLHSASHQLANMQFQTTIVHKMR